MSDVKVRAAVDDLLARAMHEKELQQRVRLYILIISVMVITTTITFFVYISLYDSEFSNKSKDALSIIIAPLVTIWSAALGFYFSRRPTNVAATASIDSDLSIYRDLISAKEESTNLRYLLKKQSIEYEDKIFELKKKIAQLEKSQGL